MFPLPRRTWVLVALVVASLVLGGAVAIAGAAPPPRSVCEQCHEDLEYAAGQEMIAIDVTRSIATVRVHRNASATWRVTSHVEPGEAEIDPDAERRNASALDSDPDLARSVVLRAIGEYHGADPNVERLQSVRANESAISFTFRDPDVARTTIGGVLLFDAFHTGGYGSGWYVDVTRLRIVGPDGSVIANDVRGAIGTEVATTRDGVLTVAGDVSTPPSFRRDDVYVAFAEPGSATDLRARLAILVATLPTAVDAFRVIHLPGLLALLAVLAVAAWRRRANDGRSGLRWRRSAGVAVAAYLAVGLLLRPPTEPPGMFWIVPAGTFLAFGLAVGLLSWLVDTRLRGRPA